MKSLRLLILIALSLIISIDYLFSQVLPSDANNLIERIKISKRSSVSIEIADTNFINFTTIGSGFLVLKNKKTFGVTNYHVIAKIPKEKFIVMGLNYDGQKNYTIISRIITDAKNDIAILEFHDIFSLNNNKKIDTTLSKPLYNGISVFAKTNEIIEGTSVLIIGYPLGIGSEYTGNNPISRIGIIAQKPNSSTSTFIIDGVTSHGNSGSPVINSQDGKLIGMICGFPSDFINAYDENGNLIVQLPYNSSLSLCVTIEMINKLIP